MRSKSLDTAAAAAAPAAAAAAAAATACFWGCYTCLFWLSAYGLHTLHGLLTPRSVPAMQAHVCRHLQQEAKGCDYLVLWLDCDREGENICFEVMDNTVKQLNRVNGQQVFRARFSAITAPEIKAAMVRGDLQLAQQHTDRCLP